MSNVPQFRNAHASIPLDKRLYPFPISVRVTDKSQNNGAKATSLVEAEQSDFRLNPSLPPSATATTESYTIKASSYHL